MQKTHYIIRARDDGNDALARFLASIRGQPDIELVKTIGPPQQPHTAVLALSAAQAQALEQRFRLNNDLMIERDRPLSMFDSSQKGTPHA
jgi:hypothetical protein